MMRKNFTGVAIVLAFLGAALALSRGGFYPPFDATGRETPAEGPVSQILVSGFGQRRGEALAVLEAI